MENTFCLKLVNKKKNTLFDLVLFFDRYTAVSQFLQSDNTKIYVF